VLAAGTNAEIQSFAKSKGARYPVFAKTTVNGADAIPLYKFLKASQGGFLGDEIKVLLYLSISNILPHNISAL
jgi:glutathione peroxidase-family protein